MTTQKEVDKLKNDVARLNKTIKEMEERVKQKKQMWYVGQEVVHRSGSVRHIKTISTEEITVINRNCVIVNYDVSFFKAEFKPNPSESSKINWIQNTGEEPEGKGLVLFKDGKMFFGTFDNWIWDLEDHDPIKAYAIIEVPELHYF